MGHPSVYPTGATLYDPPRAWSGYTLFQATEHGAVLVDMNGRVVREWPELHGFPNKILPGGAILGHSGERDPRYGMQDMLDLIQVDWEGNVTWKFDRYEQVSDPGNETRWMARAHHDYQRAGNPVGYYAPGLEPQVDGGNTLILAHTNLVNEAISDKLLLDDTIIEVDWQGNVVWEWRCSDHFHELGFDDAARTALYNNPNMRASGGGMGDWMHINSMSQGLPGAGNILIFDNGGWAGYGAPNPASTDGVKNAWRDYSRILEINPLTLDIEWRYSPYEADLPQPTDSYRFYSPYISNMQRLENGNTLINEGSNGRIFEVTRDHEIVWEYISPFWGKTLNNNMVYRAYRIPYGWIPRRSPKLFRVAESAFTPIGAASELESERPVLLFIGAERCVHCRKLWQLLAQGKLSSRIAQLDTRYLDADRHQALASDLGVRGLPTLLLIKPGQLALRAPAQLSVDTLFDWLNRAAG